MPILIRVQIYRDGPESANPPASPEAYSAWTSEAEKGAVVDFDLIQVARKHRALHYIQAVLYPGNQGFTGAEPKLIGVTGLSVG